MCIRDRYQRRVHGDCKSMNLGQLIHKHYLSLLLFNIPFSLMLGIVCIMQEHKIASHEACDVSVRVFLVILMAKDLWSFVLALTIFLSSLLISKICRLKSFCTVNTDSAIPSMFTVIANALLVYSLIQGIILLSRCGSRLLSAVQCFIVYQILFSLITAYRFLHEAMLTKELNSPTAMDMQQRLVGRSSSTHEMKVYKIEVDKVRNNIQQISPDGSPALKGIKRVPSSGTPSKLSACKNKDLMKPLMINRDTSETFKVQTRGISRSPSLSFKFFACSLVLTIFVMRKDTQVITSEHD
eukprot:TRINITY_DN13378_c0_g1_i1.p1 TRINITY_DN13378_c0_g1~~TRINITY_DN13378_c0_g1_i1.p1  ORF type:complete len:317 (-),score=72.76 TRINITY_DN13378_c0_g1_i1:229-1119(-)